MNKYKKYLPTILISAFIVVIVVFLVIISNVSSPSGSATSNKPADSKVVSEVANIKPSVISAIGTGNVNNPLVNTKGTKMLISDSKPEVLYMGAEYCPYCAAERWSIIAALGRFGTFKGLSYTSSSSTDAFPSTATFSFYKSTYTSNYITFVPVEETTQDPNTTLQTPTDQEKNLFNKYDYPPYVSQSGEGGIPFIDIANIYISSGAAYTPQILSGLSQSQIASSLTDTNSSTAKAIVGSSNYLTAAICKVINNKDKNTCSSSIMAIESKI